MSHVSLPHLLAHQHTMFVYSYNKVISTLPNKYKYKTEKKTDKNGEDAILRLVQTAVPSRVKNRQKTVASQPPSVGRLTESVHRRPYKFIRMGKIVIYVVVDLQSNLYCVPMQVNSFKPFCVFN